MFDLFIYLIEGVVDITLLYISFDKSVIDHNNYSNFIKNDHTNFLKIYPYHI